jgi:bifunctional non-homologous end joining protein LigD
MEAVPSGAMAGSKEQETRDGVTFSSLDAPLFDGAGATKRDLVDYLDAISDRILPVLADRPLSVIRARPGQAPFMQKNVPKYAPEWIRTTTMWAEASKRDVAYALCDDRPTLLWFANQRAVEYHPALFRASRPEQPSHLVLDLDPPEGSGFDLVVRAARLVQQVLVDAGLDGAVKTSGAKGIHVFVPVAEPTTWEEAAAATRALAARAVALDPDVATSAFVKEERGGRVFVDATRAGGATVAATYSPRARPGVPVSFPVTWDELDEVVPTDLTVRTALERLGSRDPWAEHMPAPQVLPAEVLEEGRAIPVARVQAMHEGKRRKRAQRAQDDG